MTYASEVLADSPLAWWRLGDASGTAMTDSSGNAHDGTYTASPTLGVTGALVGDADTAATFNGTTQYGSLAWASWQNSAAITVEAWVKTTATSIRSIIDRDNTGSAARVFQFRTTAAGKVEFIRIDNAAGAVTTVTSTGVTTINNGAWHHVAATYDGSTILLYVDGVLDQTTTAAGGIRQPGGTTKLSVGVNFSTAGGSAFFAGSIDEVAYYGAVLTGTRIAAHYAAGTGAGTAASGTGSLSLSGSGAAQASAASAGALNLSGSGSASATVSGSGALALSGAGSSGGTLAAAGTGALSISGSGTAPPGTGAGSGDLALSGSGAAAGLTAGSGALTLSGSGAAAGAVAGAGDLALSGSGYDSAAASGAAALVLSATGAGTGSVAGSGSGLLTLTGIQASPASSEAFLELGVLTAEALALYLTDLTNALNGRRRRARGTATVGRAVAPLPPGRTFGTRYDKALAYPVPTMVDGRPT